MMKCYCGQVCDDLTITRPSVPSDTYKIINSINEYQVVNKWKSHFDFRHHVN